MRKSIQNCIEILAILEDQQFLKKKLLKQILITQQSTSHWWAHWFVLKGHILINLEQKDRKWLFSTSMAIENKYLV